ncbi:MAG: hypothetical protein AAGD13_01820 [Pseudomonadota bacterium]
MTRVFLLDRFESVSGPRTLADFSEDQATALPQGDDEPLLDEPTPAIPAPDDDTSAEDAPTEAEIAARLMELLGEISSSLDGLKTTALNNFSKQSTVCLRHLLPDLLDENLAREISITATGLMAERLTAEAEMTASADIYEALIESLQALEPMTEVRVRKVNDYPAGTARLHWALGGAEFTRDAYLKAAAEVLTPAQEPRSEGDHRNG